MKSVFYAQLVAGIDPQVVDEGMPGFEEFPRIITLAVAPVAAGTRRKRTIVPSTAQTKAYDIIVYK